MLPKSNQLTNNIRKSSLKSSFEAINSSAKPAHITWMNSVPYCNHHKRLWFFFMFVVVVVIISQPNSKRPNVHYPSSRKTAAVFAKSPYYLNKLLGADLKCCVCVFFRFYMSSPRHYSPLHTHILVLYFSLTVSTLSLSLPLFCSPSLFISLSITLCLQFFLRASIIHWPAAFGIIFN